MAMQENDILLHKLSHHTNLSVPCNEHVSPDKFPEQDSDLLNTMVNIKYRNMYIPDLNNYTGPDAIELDTDNIYEINSKVVRCDKSEPFRMITISEDYQFMFVSDSRYYTEQVVQYPIQLSELIGINCYNQYPGNTDWVEAITLRVDNGEPCYSILIEFIDDDTVRFVLGDECFSKLLNYFKVDDDFKSIIAGFDKVGDQNKPIFTTQKSNELITEIRQYIIETILSGGIKIYGSKNS